MQVVVAVVVPQLVDLIPPDMTHDDLSDHPCEVSAWVAQQAAVMTTPVVAGVDEVGRGALFGPVVAGAVILSAAATDKLQAAGVRDSKKLSGTKRNQLSILIWAEAEAVGLGAASVREIDRLNILQASLLAMRRAVLNLKICPTLCLVDGNQLIPNLPIPQQRVVKGDETVLAIAAASIVAKVWRDDLILRLAQRYPHYGLASHKGYGTAQHRLAIQQFGPSALHRLSFSPCGNYEANPDHHRANQN